MNEPRRVIEKADGSIVVLIPAMKDRARPCRIVRYTTKVVKQAVYDFDTETVSEVDTQVKVPVYEYLHTDEQWAKRCFALMEHKLEGFKDRPFVDTTANQLPKAERSKWRLRDGRIEVAP